MPLCSMAIRDRLRNFVGNAGGNVGVIFAFALLPILLATGAALDYGRYNSVRAKIQTALDSTGLMLAHNVGVVPSEELVEQADTFFRENFPEETGVTINSLDTGITNDKITMRVAASVDTYIMHLAGVPYLTANVDTEVIRAEDSYEVVLVLDNTGSMRGSKIEALKEASSLLVDNLFGETAVHPLLKIGLVPFEHAVNVGVANKNAAWMDTDGLNPLHYDNFDEASMKAKGLTRFDLFDRIRNATWAGCVEARAYPLDVNDTAPSSANPNTLFVPYFAPDEPDFVCSRFRSNGECRSKDYKTYPYSNTYLPDGLADNASDKDKQENVDKYKVNVSASGGSPNDGCTANPILPLTNKKADVTSALEDMKAGGYTNITEGLMWGLRVISPAAPFTEGKAYGEKDNHKIVILLTDGKNEVPAECGSCTNMAESGNDNKSQFGPYGFAASDRLVDTRNKYTFMSAMNGRTAEACNAVKAEGIDVFTITFQAGDPATETLMRNCATKPDMYYDSPSASTLNSVFRAIATRISELRIAK